MLLRSMRVTKTIFGSRSSRKEQLCVAAKAVKSVHSATQSFGNMVAKINILNSCTNVVAKINIRVFKV